MNFGNYFLEVEERPYLDGAECDNHSPAKSSQSAVRSRAQPHTRNAFTRKDARGIVVPHQSYK